MQSDTSNLSDEEIVVLALKDQAAFRYIVDRYDERLGRYLTRLGIRNREDREDVLQDVFVKVYRNLNDFDTDLSFSSWIYRIAHNEAISAYRKKSVRPEGHLVDEGDLVLEFVSGKESGADKLFDESINADEVAKALDELSERYKDPIILRFFEHKEYDEISDILKIPIGTVGTLIHRGKKQLETLLDEEKLHI